MAHVSIPTVHLNGTSRDELERQLIDAMEALRHARSKLIAMQPNGRDYYPQGDAAIGVALQRHSARLAKIDEVAAELQAIAEGLDASADLRRAERRGEA
jgi:hypothetical protein